MKKPTVKLNSPQGIRINTIDYLPQVLTKAKEIADSPIASVIQIEQQMRALYFHPYIYPEIVETYNKLEKKWKILTNYKENTRTPVLFEEKSY